MFSLRVLSSTARTYSPALKLCRSNSRLDLADHSRRVLTVSLPKPVTGVS
jgi:hypothetical protein